MEDLCVGPPLSKLHAHEFGQSATNSPDPTIKIGFLPFSPVYLCKHILIYEQEMYVHVCKSEAFQKKMACRIPAQMSHPLSFIWITEYYGSTFKEVH